MRELVQFHRVAAGEASEATVFYTDGTESTLMLPPGAPGKQGPAGVTHAHGNVLWTGDIYLNATQTVNLSQNITDQPTGVLLVWSHYGEGKPQNLNWQTTFVPKYIANLGGYIRHYNGTHSGVTFWKIVYVKNDSLTGHAVNGTAPSAEMILRAVIGV